MQKKIFVCSKCDAQFPKWSGRCLDCGAWGSLAQQQAATAQKKEDVQTTAAPGAVVSFADVDKQPRIRISTGSAELDRVLGGGLVEGSLTLLGGEPGIGKSTLALMLTARVTTALYCSAEESVQQVLQHAQRLGVTASGTLLLHSGMVEEITATIRHHAPRVCVVDSIQTIATADAAGEKGSVAQVRAATVKMLEAAKQTGCAIVLIGHVTKDGAVAGPKTLEHLVDCVLYFEGDSAKDLRIVRCVKNRFGATNEIGVFCMTSSGLEEVSDPSGVLLADRAEMPGSVLSCVLEGSRPLMIEVQALVNKTSFGYPERRASGFDVNRLKLLLAVLESRAGLHLGSYDVHINIVGGAATREPAADLAVALAVVTAYKQKTLASAFAASGEIDLAGNVRPVKQLEKRINECKRLGIKTVFVPSHGRKEKTPGVIGVATLADLIGKT